MLGVTRRRLFAAITFFAAIVTMGNSRICGQQKPAEEPVVDMQWAAKIPMRDGVKLNATIFTAHGQKEPVPVIFTFTPYIGDSYTDRAVYFAKHGESDFCTPPYLTGQPRAQRSRSSTCRFILP